MLAPAITFKKKTDNKVEVLFAGATLMTFDIPTVQKFLNELQHRKDNDNEDLKRIKTFLAHANRINKTLAAHPATYVQLVIPHEAQRRENIIKAFKIFSLAGITNYAKMVVVLNGKYNWPGSGIKYFRQSHLGTDRFLSYVKEYVDGALSNKKEQTQAISKDEEIINTLLPRIEKCEMMRRGQKLKLMAALKRTRGNIPDEVLHYDLIVS